MNKFTSLAALALTLGASGLAPATTRIQRPIGGFIPGDYLNNCGNCECRYLGSKHSMCCEACGQCCEDEFLLGSSLREVTTNNYGEAIFTRYLPAVDTKWLDAHGKQNSRVEPVIIVGGNHFQHISLAERFAQEGIPLIFQAPREHRGLALGESLNEHYPFSPYRAKVEELTGALKEIESAQWVGNYSIYYGGEKPERQRWKGRGGMFEKSLLKRRKAAKAAKKARKKSR